MPTHITKRAKLPGVTRLELARILDVSPRHISRLLEDGLPRLKRGRGGHASRFDPKAARAWYDAHRSALSSAALAEARVRKELAQAAESEQRVAQRAKTLIAIEDARRLWMGITTRIRSRLLSLPTEIAEQSCRVGSADGAAGVEALWRRAITETLIELADPALPDAAVPKTPKATSRARRRYQGTSRGRVAR